MEDTAVNPNLTTYSIADQIERHRIASRPEMLRTPRTRPMSEARVRSDVEWLARLGSAALSLVGRLPQTVSLLRQPAASRS